MERIFSKRNDRHCRVFISPFQRRTQQQRIRGEGGERKERSWFCVLRAVVETSSFLLRWTEKRAARQRGSKGDEEKERGGRGGGGTTPRRVEASSAHLPVRKDGGLGMRSYRGIPGFELVPPTKSIAPVRPPREELFLFSHSSYNRPNPPSHPPTSSSYADGIGQSSSASRGFVKELRIHAHQLWNRACSGMDGQHCGYPRFLSFSRYIGD